MLLDCGMGQVSTQRRYRRSTIYGGAICKSVDRARSRASWLLRVWLVVSESARGALWRVKQRSWLSVIIIVSLGLSAV